MYAASETPSTPASARSTASLSAALERARAHTDELFALVRPDSLYERPIPERHRIIFYVGHLEAFDWNLLARRTLDMPGFNPALDQLFAFGIDPPLGKLPEDAASDWPHLDEARAYVRRVRAVLDNAPGPLPEQLLHVAIEHRLMHAETFAYMLHNLPFDRKDGPRERPAPLGPAPQPSMVDIPAGEVRLSCRPEDGFGWDNEFPEHTEKVDGFSLGKYKVTNGEYLRFVAEGAAAPHFWNYRSGKWFYRAMFREIPLAPDWPVYVTQREAAAYAAWAGKRLPSEAEFHRAAYGAVGGEHFAPDPARDNFDFRRWDPIPVHCSGENPAGLVGMIGNGWEWTATLFAPFPGFEPFPFYPGYSANFFDGGHYVLKGASPRTAAPLARPSFRNWFRPEYPYVYAGFRVAES